MSIDPNTWKIKSSMDPNLIIGQVLSFTTALEQSKVVKKSIGGTIYVSTVGDSIPYANVSVLCNLTEKNNFLLADANGAKFSVTYRDVTYNGYLEETPDFEVIYPNEWFSTEVKLLIEDT